LHNSRQSLLCQQNHRNNPRTPYSQELHSESTPHHPSHIHVTLPTHKTTIQLKSRTNCSQELCPPIHRIHVNLLQSLQHNHPTQITYYLHPTIASTHSTALFIESASALFTLCTPTKHPNQPRTACIKELQPDIPDCVIHLTSTFHSQFRPFKPPQLPPAFKIVSPAFHPASVSVFLALTLNAVISSPLTHSLSCTQIPTSHHTLQIIFSLPTQLFKSTHVLPVVRNSIQTFHITSSIASSSHVLLILSTNNKTIQHQPTYCLQSGIASRHFTSHHPSQHPPQSSSLSPSTTQPFNMNPRTCCSQELHPDIQHRIIHPNIHLSLSHSLRQQHNHPTSTHVLPAVRNCIQTFHIASSIPTSISVFLTLSIHEQHNHST